MKRMRKWCFLIMLLVIVLVPGGKAGAASAKKQALKAYSEFLAANESSYYEEFAIAYVDNDSIPELVLGTALYTYKNSAVVKLENWSAHGVWGYYKKKGIVVITYAHGNVYGDCMENYGYFKMKKSGAVNKLYKYYASSRRNGKKISESWSYTNAKGKKISKSSFNSKLKKLVGTKKMTKFKKYQNTSANRAKYLK